MCTLCDLFKCLDKRGEVDREGDVRLGRISDAVKVLLECIGEDVEREGLLKTPERYAKALLYLTKGYTESLEGKFWWLIICFYMLV